MLHTASPPSCAWDQPPRTPGFLPHRVLALMALRNIGQVFSRPSLNLVGLLGCCSQISGVLGLGAAGPNSAPSRHDASGCVLLTWLAAAGLDPWATASARLPPVGPLLGRGCGRRPRGPLRACGITSCWMPRGAGGLPRSQLRCGHGSPHLEKARVRAECSSAHPLGLKTQVGAEQVGMGAAGCRCPGRACTFAGQTGLAQGTGQRPLEQRPGAREEATYPSPVSPAPTWLSPRSGPSLGKGLNPPPAGRGPCNLG